MKNSNVAFGTLAGLAIGGLAGILFAPEKGSITRQQLIDKRNDFMDDIKSKFDELHASLSQKLESTKKDAEEFVDTGKAKYDHAKKEVKDNFKNFGANNEHATQ